MVIDNNQPLSPSGPQIDPNQQVQRKNKTAEDSAVGVRADSLTLKAEISITTYNKSGKLQGVNEKEQNAFIIYESIKLEIQKQSFSLLMQQSGKDKEDPLQKLLGFAAELMGTDEDPLGLGSYFANNPEDLEQIQQGIIPDYFNIENTGQRILDIWLGGFSGEGDAAEFAENTKAMINQAYDEISSMLGGLPDIVEDTRDWIMEQLDGYAQGQAQNIIA
ncbi:hypothetical protein KAR48_05875 [bacterium]|nr:hypothetical protein [bacterium]